jgi:hypothetical protein
MGIGDAVTDRRLFKNAAPPLPQHARRRAANATAFGPLQPIGVDFCILTT